MLYPARGSVFQIKSYKHDGNLHRTWDKNVTLERTKDRLIAANDQTIVRESDGSVWRTEEPAICCFYTEYWFNVIAMVDRSGVHYYCNLSSPFTYKDRTLQYIDYDLDLQVYPDKTYDLLDEDEFAAHQEKMGYPEHLTAKIWDHVDYVIHLIRKREEPFAPNFIDEWHNQFLSYKGESF